MIDKPLSYYKWFWQDFRANRKVQRMNYIERGLYRELLDECWADGSLPNDIPELAEICGCPDDVMENAWQVLSKCFIDRGDGRLVNDKLESLRTDTDKTRLARAESGKKGAIAKQMPSNSLANASNCHIEEKRREEKSNSVPKGTGAKAPLSPDEIIFGYGVPLLTNAGTPDKQARSFLGGLRKSHGDDSVVNALRDCIREKPLQPLEWLAKVLPPKCGPPKMNKQEALEASNRAVAERLLKKEGLI